MKKADNPTTRKPAPRKPVAIKQSAKPKATARPAPKAELAKAPVPTTLPKPAAKPLNADSGQAELAQTVARLSSTTDKLAQTADSLAASTEKLGSTADALAEATQQAGQRQSAEIAIKPPAEENTNGADLPDFAAPPDDPEEPDTSGGE